MQCKLCESLQIKYGLGPDATLVTVLEKIKERVDRAIFSESDDLMWPDLIKDYRWIVNMVDPPYERAVGF